ncbi:MULTISPECIES: MBL fold metallo-hydrolase [unclassified Variovorax]|jgi:glyoxylase-like metal-dependent hydrolase (beta-lactamase superfamily II)/8-oxo-dGTP pyrophosphatase MutT (NUDIX family)|uniref:MBL fold metallo-hydrolase n=1 Tax=unclassified Variovorax TaxID=663243 RepID=UPI000F7DC4FC|nr:MULTISPECIES: MBL fold metallo-hydrolase [unclassified Variovorax]RSZ43961.1 MBL fold metallo-hydrolase [Variovorax sp. 553]RSZ45385.1 MBL fold metallo-hydrolase [Variovorax sp. 679]
MVRSSQQLHIPREPAPLRPAATVLLLRDSAAGIEVLMTRRSATASFAPGAYVFPGGHIDEADEAAKRIATRRPTQSRVQRTQAIAAIREAFEELGILLAHHADGSPVTAEEIASMDRADTAGTAFADQCAARGLVLDSDRVFTFAHWMTDRDLPRRFDVPFLVARMPEGQSPKADESEQFEPCWVRPADALARHEAGTFFMIFPTVRTLQRMAAYATVDALLAACAGETPLWTSCPRAGLLKGEDARYMEHESPYGELALVCPDGQVLHALDWQSEHPVPLLKNVMRLTAPNPSAMTGPGTNSYIVGDAATGYIVIDPGPNDFDHIGRLWRATQGDIRMIVCTHSHADHSPGAAPLQALCKNGSKPPILGLASKPTARATARFTPERELDDGERLVLSGTSATGEAITHTLRVIHTPGHAANHLCLVLEEDGLLFSGDHILNGSTTVVDPPDGDMSAYLDSLDALDAACEAGGIEFILPAHGYVIGFARTAIGMLKAHRLKREAKIAAAMQKLPEGTPDDWLPLAYDDVPERMWPVAARSLAAHVARIRQLAAAR